MFRSTFLGPRPSATAILAAVMSFALLTLPSRLLHAEQIIFSDGDFSSWTFSSIASPGSSASATRIASGGDPDAYISTTTVTGDTAWAVCLSGNAVWNPAVQGALGPVMMELDSKSVSAWGTGAGIRFLAEQDGNYYIAPSIITPYNAGPSTAWHSADMTAYYAASQFVELTGPGSNNLNSHPDFSSSGSPIDFGFITGCHISGTYTQLFDNWSVTTDVPEPTIWSMLIAALVVGTWPAVKRLRRMQCLTLASICTSAVE